MINVIYFLSSLILSLILSGAVLAGLVKSLQVNWLRKNRKPVGYLAPVALLAAFLVITLRLTVPRLLDTVSIAGQNFLVGEVQVEAGDIGWSTLTDGNRKYYYNQWHFHPEAGKTYRISYTPRSFYIYEFVEFTDSTGGQP